MAYPLPTSEIVIRLLAAVALGALLGWERETHGKAAGFRTNVLIALGSAAFTLISLRMALHPGFRPDDRLDPIRALQGIIGGIGFLGAGSIIRSGGSVHGMTTAATIWVVGAAGIACGIGSYDIAASSIGVCFVVLWGLGIVEKRLMKNHNHHHFDASQDPDRAG
ncbi:MAG: MgtC/SapB family protein [Planctomycetia bacterium]|nr:MgtC/SapB family protein [Planctomycetia bacterium]